MIAVPVAPVRSVETGVIYREDNLARLRQFEPESIDLIYLDPPFFSNRHYEVIWGDESEIRSFEDRWKGGIGHYIGWMEPRLREMHRVLKPTGSIYLHCDPHASHYLKVAMDGIFGADHFRNEIIWHYSGWNKKLKSKFESRTDTLLFYGKGSKRQLVFNSYALPWASEEEYVKKRKQKVRLDENGRKYVLSDAGGGKRVKRFLDEAMATGVYVDNVWEIDKLNNSSKEKLGWPTQKPEELLHRVVAASSNRGEIVLDPFCGCGTAVAVAHMLDRRWIGIDISPTAVGIIAERLNRIGATVSIENGIETVDDLRGLKPREFENQIIRRVYGTHNTKTPQLGIDGFSFMEKLPIEIKQQDAVGRPVVDKFEAAIQRYGAHKGYIIAFSFTKGAYEEAARVRAEGIEIALIEVKTLFEAGRDVAPRPAATQLEQDLLMAARLAAKRPGTRRARPGDIRGRPRGERGRGVKRLAPWGSRLADHDRNPHDYTPSAFR